MREAGAAHSRQTPFHLPAQLPPTRHVPFPSSIDTTNTGTRRDAPPATRPTAASLFSQPLEGQEKARDRTGRTTGTVPGRSVISGDAAGETCNKVSFPIVYHVPSLEDGGVETSRHARWPRTENLPADPKSETRPPPPHFSLRNPLPPAAPATARTTAWKTVQFRSHSRPAPLTSVAPPVAGTNLFNALQVEEGENEEAADLSFSQIAAAAAVLPPPPPPARPAAPPLTPAKTARETILLLTSLLEVDNPLHSLAHPIRLRALLQARVSSTLAPDILHAKKLEKGDVLVTVRASSASSLQPALLAVCPIKERRDSETERTVMIHFVPDAVTEEELKVGLRRWSCGVEGDVKVARKLVIGAGKTCGSWAVEMTTIEGAEMLAKERFHTLPLGLVIEVEKGKSRGQRRTERTRKSEKERDGKARPQGERKEEAPTDATHSLPPAAFAPTQSTPARLPPTLPHHPAPSPTRFPPIPCISFDTTIRSWADEVEDEEKTMLVIPDSQDDDGRQQPSSPSSASSSPLWSRVPSPPAPAESPRESERSTQTEVAETDEDTTGENSDGGDNDLVNEEVRQGRDSEEEERRSEKAEERRWLISLRTFEEEGSRGSPASIPRRSRGNVAPCPRSTSSSCKNPPPSTASLTIPKGWTLLIPPPHHIPEGEASYPRSLALVSPRFSLPDIQLLPIASRDVIAFDLRLRNDQSIRVIGVYNPHLASPTPNRTVEFILLPLLEDSEPGTPLVVLGDFNLRHPAWDPLLTEAASETAEDAKLILEEAGLTLLRQPGEPTFTGFDGSPPRTLDLVWGNLRAEELLVSALIDDELECNSDHRPIRLTLQSNIEPTPPLPPRRRWRHANPDSILSAFETALSLAPPPLLLSLESAVDCEAVVIDHLLQSAVAPVPFAKKGNPLYAHRWWTEVLTTASMTARKTRNRVHHISQNKNASTADKVEAEMKAKVARNRIKSLGRREKRRARRERLENADVKDLWKIRKEEEGRSANAIATPPIRKPDGTHALSTLDKFDALIPELLPVMQPRNVEEGEKGDEARDAATVRPLRQQVSPLHCVSHSEAWTPPLSKQSATHVRRTPHPSTDTRPGPPPPARAQPPTLPWPEVTEEEVRRAVFAARPLAACGPDDVPNLVLQILFPLLQNRLVPLCAAILRLGHLPRSWRDASRVVLKKPKKDDYSLPKAYRLISLERCIAKIPEAIMAQRLAHLAESHDLVPACHFGARKGRGAEEAVACFVDDVKRQWRAGNTVVGIALDAAKAFPSVREERLAQDMEERGLPRQAINFVRSWMRERRVKLLFEGKESEWIEWQSGLPQGSPLSPILFLIYNSQLLRDAQTDCSYGYGWVDDLNILAWGKGAEQAVSNAQRIVPNLEAWSTSHSTSFETTKTTVTLLLPPRTKRPTILPPVILAGQALAYSPTLGMLGCTLDDQFTFKPHTAAVAAKAATSLTVVAQLARSQEGMKPGWVRMMVEATAMKRLEWGAALWYKPGDRVSKAMENVQRSAARLICGGYRTTSLQALEVESNLIPLPLRFKRSLFRLALRAHASLHPNPLHLRFRLARIVTPRTHPSPLHVALHSFPAILPPSSTVEPIHPSPIAPWQQSPPTTLIIPDTKEAGIEAHNKLLVALESADHARVYSDGSLKEGVVGAGAVTVVRSGGVEGDIERSEAMGRDRTVYEGELQGAQTGILSLLPLLSSSNVHLPSLYIFADNQSALRNLVDPSPTPGQQIRLQLRSLLLGLCRTHPETTITLQ
ncbi:hypothetical protein JCM11641_005311 [Rhodosporidiobolus odoratus]